MRSASIRTWGPWCPTGSSRDRLEAWARAVFVARIEEEGLFDAGSPVPGRGATERPPWVEVVAKRTDAAMKSLLQKGRGCLVCHVKEGGKIVPPLIPSNWLLRARFDHKTHRFEACATCHDITASTSAADLVLPPHRTCASCHKADGARTTCVTCHPYHPLGHSDAWR